jgi:hypothetical protein
MKNKNQIIWYKHFDTLVAVRNDLKGKHREFCLCFRCGRFSPDDKEMNCPMAELLFSIDKFFHLTTPVWECPQFINKISGDDKKGGK